MTATHHADVAVVGAGIAGLAHAREAALRGYSVVLFERNEWALGASVRNFGMVLPLGAPPGPIHQRALRGRQVWAELAREVGFWHEQAGMLIPAYHDDEMAILREFAERGPDLGYPCTLLDRNAVQQHCPSVRADGLKGGLWSPSEMLIDPREAMSRLPDYLARSLGVTLRFGAAVTSIEMPYVRAGGETWRVGRVVVCSGADFETLYPEVHRTAGFVRCKLQMMRTEPQPDGWRLGPMLATGLTLRHYPAFGVCPSLPELKARIARDRPELDRWGIHVMAAQNGAGEVIIGDSHEYGLTPTPFDRPEIDDLILDYLRTVLALPSERIAERWHGVYAKHGGSDVFRSEPEPGVMVVNGFAGGGMTTSFALAQEVFDSWAG